MDTPQPDKIRLGREAERFLADPLFKEIFRRAEEHFTARWKDASSLDAREDAHRSIIVLRRLEAELKSLALTGAMERRRLDDAMPTA